MEMIQIKFGDCVTCNECQFGRNLGANDYACRNDKLYGSNEKRIHKANYSCGNGIAK